jgi:DNA-binding MarR family transcriptional regulator
MKRCEKLMTDIGSILFDLLGKFIDNYISNIKDLSQHHLKQESGIYIIDYIGQDKKTMTEIANQLSLPPSTTTRHINKLVEEGIVRRYTPNSNRRTILIELTKKGEDIYNEINSHRNQFIKLINERFSTEEQQIIQRFLTEITEETSHFD